MNIGIYKITSPSNKVYIGQSINFSARKHQYKSSCKNKSNKHLGPKLYNSLLKHGFDTHKFELIEECNLGQLNERETYWKQYYLNLVNQDWSKVLFHELYDMGGGPRSEETKHKISQSNLGKIVSLETRNKKSKSMLNKFHSEETKKLMSILSKGKSKSNEHILNMMKNRQPVIDGVKLANSKPIIQYDLNMNQIKEWNSVTEAKQHFKGDIGACCRGRQITACNYIWKFKNLGLI